MTVKKIECGWGGHYCCAMWCLFRRNTHLKYGDKYIVVSTVGNFQNPVTKNRDAIGVDRYYETACFWSNKDDTEYHDADMDKRIDFNSQWQLGIEADDNDANFMHETVVAEIIQKLKSGEL